MRILSLKNLAPSLAQLFNDGLFRFTHLQSTITVDLFAERRQVTQPGATLSGCLYQAGNHLHRIDLLLRAQRLQFGI